ncbi:MAG: twin-arginine translocation signal domain-containing protein [Pirellulaceae bacterium]|jgi:hypothetical protein|nr:twin-arginine translocation signal domain-containing protein [Pirellulaceae bacterium]MDP6718886.1 twin-arginine translocation signal domain-containing protein [Pirellulaceae bacterium]
MKYIATRREFLKATGAAAAVAAAGTPIASAQVQEKAVSNHKPLTKVNCFSEDGELKEVIFGRVDDLSLPEYAPIFDFAGPQTVSLLKKAGGKLFKEADPEWYKQVYDSIENVVDFLKGRGIVVHRPRDHTEDENANFALRSKMVNNVYNRDSLVAIGNTLVESSFLTPSRIRNKYAVRYISMGLMKAGNRVISMPQPLDTYRSQRSRSCNHSACSKSLPNLRSNGYRYRLRD